MAFSREVRLRGLGAGGVFPPLSRARGEGLGVGLSNRSEYSIATARSRTPCQRRWRLYWTFRGI